MTRLALKHGCAVFRAEVTPPIGHPLCAGWTEPAAGVSDPLYALGVVLGCGDAPVVLCAVDWCEISNEDHVIWREKLAAAAGTTPERVAVQCLHQHNAPWPDRAAQKLVSNQEGAGDVMDIEWCDRALDGVAQAVRNALEHAQTITHVATGQAKVEMVASNRRIPGPGGRIKAVRWTACKDPEVRDEPEGLIDTMLKTVSFWSGKKKLAALQYYAVHPCSYYGDGLITGDFVAEARERRTREEGVPHIYFTGCAGNISPGKYNDGAPKNRRVLADRIHRAMVESEQETDRASIEWLKWRTEWVRLPPREDMKEPELLETLSDPEEPGKDRIRAALKIAYLRRWQQTPIPLMSLHIGGDVCLLNLPGEAFIEYQLYAQEKRSDAFVAVASYGDCGTGYIPLARSYEEGGYEPEDAFVSPEAEAIMKAAITKLLKV